jgi:hypothetical protein
MANEELIKEAKGLGIQNAEALNKTQLTKAIELAKAANAERDALMSRAVELGFDKELLAEFSNENLQKAISEAEEERAAAELASKKAEFISEFLGIDYTDATLEEVSEAAKNVVVVNIKSRSEVLQKHLGIDFLEVSPEELNKILSEKPKGIEVVETKVPAGKTDKHFEASNGIHYVFDDEAPEAFRFADVIKTQKEWLTDKEAMELMIQGGVSYIKPKKK